MKLNTFDKFINEEISELATSYTTYIFNHCMFKLDCGSRYSWQYFKNYQKDGELELYPRVHGVRFSSCQGFPSIEVPTKEHNTIWVNDIDDFVLTDEYAELQKAVDFGFLPPEDLF